MVGGSYHHSPRSTIFFRIGAVFWENTAKIFPVLTTSQYLDSLSIDESFEVNNKLVKRKKNGDGDEDKLSKQPAQETIGLEH